MRLHVSAAIALFIFAVAAERLCAQAFTQPEGEGRVIATVIYSHSDKAFDDEANSFDIADYEKTEIYLLGEYGVTDDLTLLVTPSFRAVSIDGGDDDSGLGFLDLGARYRIVESDDYVLSVQGTVRIPGSERWNGFAQVGQTDTEIDIRAQGGASFGDGNFAILEVGYRFRTGDPPDEFHVDATLGLRVAPRWLFIANSFNVISNGAGEGIFPEQRYHNIYASAAYEASPRLTFQLGGLATVAGRNALRERGVFAGAWFRF